MTKQMTKMTTVVNTGYTDIKDRLAYNETLNVAPKTMEGIDLIGPKGIFVKLYKFTEHTTTKGGLITQKYKRQIKESGKAGVELDDFVFQARGVILYITPEARDFMDKNFTKETNEKIVVGSTVWINTMSGMSGSNQFIYDRVHPIIDDANILQIHPNQIDGIDNNVPVQEIEFLSAEQYENRLNEIKKNYEVSE